MRPPKVLSTVLDAVVCLAIGAAFVYAAVTVVAVLIDWFRTLRYE